MPGYIHDSRTPEERRRERMLFILDFLLIAPLVCAVTLVWAAGEFRQQGEDIVNAEWQEAVAPLIKGHRGVACMWVDELTPEDVVEVTDTYLAYETVERKRFDRDCKVTDWRERGKWLLPECEDFARAHQLIL